LEAFAWFEQTALSIGVREIPWVFPFALIVHSIGMGFSAGVGVIVGLRAAGVAVRIPLAALLRFLPLMWLGFVANLVSGLVLLAAYPAKALTNPVFYLKLILLAAAMWATHRLTQSVAGANLKRHAIVSLLLWAGVIASGRFLAYTHSVLLASWMV
jgi:hypothetical protein